MKFIIFTGLLMILTTSRHLGLYEARFSPRDGANVEYAQGAIERCELAHREIAPLLWLVQSEETRAAEIESRLNASVEANAGSFVVTRATEEQQRRVESGEIVLQK